MSLSRLNKNQSILPIISTIIALLSLFITFFWNFRQEKRIDYLNYQHNSLNFRPRLEILSKPNIEGVQIIPKGIHESGDSLIFDAKIGFSAKLKVINLGNDIAHLIGTIYTDTLCGNEYIRNVLKSKKLRSEKIKKELWETFFSTHEVIPGDTFLVTIDHIINNFSSNESVFHFLFIYENSTGSLFDTYYWIKFKCTPFPILPIFKTEPDSTTSVYVELIRDEVMKSIYFSEENVSRNVYSKDEKNMISEYINSIRKIVY